MRGGTAHRLNDIGGDTDRQGTRANHHHLCHGGRQRHDQLEVGSLPGNRSRFNPATQRIDFRANHVHANTTTGQLSHLRGCGKARHENQLGNFLVRQSLVRRHQAQAQGFVANALQIKTGTVIAKVYRDVISLVTQMHRDQPHRVFTGFDSLMGFFDAVGHAVAQKMFKRRRHAVKHAAIHLDGSTEQVESHLFARILGRLSDHAVQAV